MGNKGGRPRNPDGVMKPVRAKVPEEDLELLAELGYNVGQAVREFCAMKRRTMLPVMSREEAEKLLREEELIQRKSKAREQDMINALGTVDKIRAENEIVKDDINACKELTVRRLEDHKELFLKHGAGYKEVLRNCISAMPEGTLDYETALNFFDNYRESRRKPPRIGDIESLIY